ncbi:hypothetical protein LZ496_06305 [Sphingomonas sp. NSE70-1]|uniref:Phosphatidate cytidylyltransferase n=1 Tax=Sphingomonas caseinilyticus TaxID=2908205 RepID=A0ABT0RU82_9SPHN|nr:hypothetical protein [Sphingomonas caseinilyticus]MCL6698393.1 hypothetical protein [Sphingomonas caseinilyticus]
MADALRTLVNAELSQPVDPRVTAMAEAIAARHGAASRAVLFYGSCLREKQLEGLMLDFYLIVSDYQAAYGKRWLAIANRLIPPNVFPFHHDGLAAKYAVLSESDFRREVSGRARSTSVWARFAQPSRLVWSYDRDTLERVVDVIQDAAPTLFQYTLPMMDLTSPFGPGDIWKRGFALTYGAELRAERSVRPSSVVDADAERYERFGLAALARIAELIGVGSNGEVALFKRADRMARQWRRMQWKGKALSVLRLAKASLTYAGGAEYIAWKINRHAGTDIELKPWQKRHPLLAAISLLPRLLRSGAIR